ncbi:hypothetical protein Dvina_22585 [Dactylosporangium vinaceum]|uniref:Toxin-antitoxin system, toxin component n=1 Tax=Dactylosporangium vinaceum TaxID=53362 RepID=A0ABV5M777_9ACTN|nr:hypothetical protein [Dactylosporangium vinaceum]UAC00590.1 hypothetical protein Dvina_22585 [Dactylosporangium vinaceum]
MSQPQYPTQQPYPPQPPQPAPQGYPAPPAHQVQPSYPGQQPYQAPQSYQGQQPYQAPQPQGAPLVQCRFCGSVPAASVKFRGHQGMIVLMRFLSLDGPFCRDCGLSTFRSMTAKTLVQGWWGYASFIITPITVLINVVKRDKVASLPAPQPSPYGGSRQPMDPGKPLLQRPMAIIGLGIPLALFLFVVTLIVTSSST